MTVKMIPSNYESGIISTLIAGIFNDSNDCNSNLFSNFSFSNVLKFRLSNFN
jgi:hypothetical protein